MRGDTQRAAADSRVGTVSRWRQCGSILGIRCDVQMKTCLFQAAQSIWFEFNELKATGGADRA